MTAESRPDGRHWRSASTALCTDHYELTMLASTLADGTADRRCTFEVFTRRLPIGRRYGVVAGIGRLLDALDRFRFGPTELDLLSTAGVVDRDTVDWLAGYRFGGDIDGYPEGELFFPGSPLLSVSGSFAECVLLETLVLSVLNHDCAVASAAARMVTAAGDRPIIEMGSRRTHEQAAVAAARAAYLAGFASTSNLAARHRYGVPTAGTAAHAFTLLHEREADAFTAQVARYGPGTTLLVDTYDITRGIRTAVEVAGTGLGAVRIDSGDLGVLARQAREQLDRLGATETRIVVSGDLDEHSIAALRAEPVDGYGVGTSVVTGSGAPAADLVYKLVEVDRRPVEKRSSHKESRGGHKSALRRHRPARAGHPHPVEWGVSGNDHTPHSPIGTATEEVVYRVAGEAPPVGEHDRVLPVPLVRGGQPVPGLPTLEESREHLRRALITVPWEGLALSYGDPAIPTTFLRS